MLHLAPRRRQIRGRNIASASRQLPLYAGAETANDHVTAGGDDVRRVPWRIPCTVPRPVSALLERYLLSSLRETAAPSGVRTNGIVLTRRSPKRDWLPSMALTNLCVVMTTHKKLTDDTPCCPNNAILGALRLPIWKKLKVIAPTTRCWEL